MSQLYNIYKIKTKYVNNWADSFRLRKDPWSHFMTFKDEAYEINYAKDFDDLKSRMDLMWVQIKKRGQIDAQKYHKDFFDQYKYHNQFKNAKKVDQIVLSGSNERKSLERQANDIIFGMIIDQCQQEIKNGNYQYSNRFKFKKEGKPKQMFYSKKFRRFVGAKIIQQENGEYFVNSSPYVLKDELSKNRFRIE